MTVPRWFEASLLEAQDSNRPVDFTHVGEQFGIRIEEVLSPRSVKSWLELARRWKKESEEGSAEVLSFLEKECPDFMSRIPEEKRRDFLSGLWNKRA